MGAIKEFLKTQFAYFIHRHKFSPQVQVSQRALFIEYQKLAKENKLPLISDTGFSVFSQFEEDGLLLYIFAVAGEGNKTFVEIGGNDGINSNCSNLALNFGWHGLFIDGNASCIRRGRKFYSKYPTPYHFAPTFRQAFITAENINGLIADAGISGDISLLSIDIDGNDYWVWKAIDVISPRVVIVETHVEFGMNDIVVPYDANYFYPGKHPVYHGASAVAMQKMAASKGYRLVGANQYGSNTIYVRNGIADNLLPAVDVASILQHPKTVNSFSLFEEIKDWEYIRS